jgi:hypothetical protein
MCIEADPEIIVRYKEAVTRRREQRASTMYKIGLAAAV